MNDEPGVRVEIYREEDNVFDLLDSDFTIHVHHLAQPVLTITCKQYPEGVIVTEVMDHAHARLVARIETTTEE